MKLIQLEYFCAVSRYHSITQAAQKLYVTQPAISSAIRELEKEFSINLFTRSKNHLTLTTEGEAFYQKASTLLATIHETESELYDLGHQEHPAIPVELLEYGSIRASRLVQEETLDLALVNMNFYEIDKLNSYEMLSDQIVFCVSPEHPLASYKEATMEMLKDEPLIMYNTDSVLNTTLQARFDSLRIKPKVLLSASQLYTIHDFVKNQLGGAFLYSSLMENMPGCIGIPVTPLIHQEIGLIWKKGKYINSSVEKYITFTKHYAETKWRNYGASTTDK